MSKVLVVKTKNEILGVVSLFSSAYHLITNHYSEYMSEVISDNILIDKISVKLNTDRFKSYLERNLTKTTTGYIIDVSVNNVEKTYELIETICI